MPRVALGLLPLVLAACWQPRADAQSPDRSEERRTMVRTQIRARGVKDKRVLAAMEKVRRHLFVPSRLASAAYDDNPLPIGAGQTISQPYIVAIMSEALRLAPGSRVLEIGTGSGYQAAILGELCKEVYTIEIVPSLGKSAAKLLTSLGYRRVQVRIGDGYQGWPKKAPFDAVMLTAAPETIPEPLIRQLKIGGVLVAPVGPSGDQRLVRLTRTANGVRREHLLDVRFVPMTGKAQGR